jgi:renal tumor antigen
MEFDFEYKKGSGVTNLIPNYPDAAEIITNLLIYNHNHRMSAASALKHPYFKELREQDRYLQEGSLSTGINSIAPTPS